MLIAIDVAILPPPAVAHQAVTMSAALPDAGFQGLRLDDDHLPHVTLTQQFVDVREMPAVTAAVAAVLAGRESLDLRVSGGDRGSSSVWMAIRRTRRLDMLHEALMAALAPFERRGGTAAAFVDGDARDGDVAWVEGFRASAAFDRFRPHITLGHASQVPHVAPFDFEGAIVAICQLGRFCTCRTVLAQWTLTPCPTPRLRPRAVR